MQRNCVSLRLYVKLRQVHYSFPVLFSTACFRKFLIRQSSELMGGLVCKSRNNKCHANDKIAPQAQLGFHQHTTSQATSQ